MTKLPRLYVNGKFSKLVHPISVSITDNMVPLSTATMSLPRGEELPARSWVELYNPYGSAGMFRVRSPHNAYGANYSTAELEHMIAEVGDYLVKAEYSEMTDAGSAISRIFSHYEGGKWKLGKYSDMTGTVALEANHVSVLSALLGILDQTPDCMMTFDFSTKPWTVNFVKKGTKVVSEGRLSRNVTSATVTYDDSELCTRAWYQVFSEDAEGNVTSTWVSRDANVDKYDVVEGKIQTSRDMTAAEIEAVVNAYLYKHKQPRTSVNMQMVELYKITGERVDKFVVGDLFRLAIPLYDIVVELNITSIVWNDVYGMPKSAVVYLGDEEDTVVTFLHNLDATGSGATGGSGGGGAKGKQEDAWKEYWTQLDVQDKYIAMIATHQDRQGNILEQAGLSLTSDGIISYAKDNKNNLMSQVEQTATSITTTVTNKAKKDLETTIKQTATSIRTEVKNKTDGLNSKITQLSNKISLVVKDDNTLDAAKIVLGINAQTGSYVKISAGTIDLSGYVNMQEYNATKGTVQSLSSGDFTGVGVRCGTLSINAAQFTLGTSVVWKSTMKDGDGNTVNVMKWG